MKIIIFVLIFILSFLSLPASARSCDSLSYTVDEVRSKLRRAAGETELESAKDAARRAKNALEDAAYAAMECECSWAYSEFDDAATKARRARDADSGDEFVDQLNRSIRSFNSALDALRRCR
jgi:hypothetical protein